MFNKNSDYLFRYLEENEPDKPKFDEAEFDNVKELMEKRLRILSSRYKKLTHREKCIVTLRLTFVAWILRAMIKSIDVYLAKKEKLETNLSNGGEK